MEMFLLYSKYVTLGVKSPCLHLQMGVAWLALPGVSQARSARVFQVGVCRKSLLKGVSFTLNQKVNRTNFQHICETETFKVRTAVITLTSTGRVWEKLETEMCYVLLTS